MYSDVLLMFGVALGSGAVGYLWSTFRSMDVKLAKYLSEGKEVVILIDGEGAALFTNKNGEITKRPVVATKGDEDGEEASGV